MSSVRWCAKHRDGWCAVAPNEEPAEGSFSVETLCDYGITLPEGYDLREPDCGDCIDVLAGRRPKAGFDPTEEDRDDG